MCLCNWLSFTRATILNTGCDATAMNSNGEMQGMAEAVVLMACHHLRRPYAEKYAKDQDAFFKDYVQASCPSCCWLPDRPSVCLPDMGHWHDPSHTSVTRAQAHLKLSELGVEWEVEPFTLDD